VRTLSAFLLGSATSETQSQAQTTELTPDERGWSAIALLHEGGYGFIGQFAVGPDGTAEWVQSERVVEGLSDLFLGGMRGLETKWRQGSEVQVGDVAWAALDVALIAGSVKLVKALALARTAQAAATGARAAAGMGISPWALQFLFWFVALSLR
jgi:hypothetical protein